MEMSFTHKQRRKGAVPLKRPVPMGQYSAPRVILRSRKAGLQLLYRAPVRTGKQRLACDDAGPGPVTSEPDCRSKSTIRIDLDHAVEAVQDFPAKACGCTPMPAGAVFGLQC